MKYSTLILALVAAVAAAPVPEKDAGAQDEAFGSTSVDEKFVGGGGRVPKERGGGPAWTVPKRDVDTSTSKDENVDKLFDVVFNPWSKGGGKTKRDDDTSTSKDENVDKLFDVVFNPWSKGGGKTKRNDDAATTSTDVDGAFAAAGRPWIRGKRDETPAKRDVEDTSS